MDAASAKFKSAQADLKRRSYERVVKDTTTQTGTIYYQRRGSGDPDGAEVQSTVADQVVEIKDGDAAAVRARHEPPDADLGARSNQSAV